jgi:murein DD-endopeptidase MepM/ murein hydrolase activator NlpD
VAVLVLVVSLFAAGSTCFVSPVEGPVIDPFRPPPCPWCPGNRGLEIDTTAGDPVLAMGEGRVTFAGPVAGVLYVTVDHPSGLRSTVGRLREIRVRSGQQVASSQVIATAGDTTIVTVRSGDEYLDPAPLIGRPSWRPRLVPSDGTKGRPARPGPLRCGLGRVGTGDPGRVGMGGAGG